MDFSVLLLPGTFIAIAFIITKSNAKYLLSGYNTMSESERANVDLDGYLRFFKGFHLFLGISLLGLILLIRIVSDSLADAFMVIYPLLAYAVFAINSIPFFKPTRFQLGFNRALSGFLVALALGVLYMSIISFKESEIKIQTNKLELTGIYGVTIDRRDLIEVRILDQLPPVSSKINGFNGGPYNKGDFRLSDRRRVKLFVNMNTKTFLLLKTRKRDIYFSSMQVNMHEIYDKVCLWKEAGVPQAD